MANYWDEPIGRVLSASTAGFSVGARVNQLDAPGFGMIVRAQPRSENREVVYGLLYDIRIDDDPMVKQLVLADSVSEEAIRDQHYHRIVPVEMKILAIGYLHNGGGDVRYMLPPRPPLSLDPVYLCSPDEMRDILSRFDFFRMVLGNSLVPGEQLLAATLLNVSVTYPEREQYPFLVTAGKEAARLLSNDLARLDNLLRLIYPA